MHRIILAAELSATASHQQIAQFINRNRPAFRNGGATGIMIRSGNTVHFILEGPQAALDNTIRQAKASPLFESAEPCGSMPIRFRAFDKICLAYAQPETLGKEMRSEITMLTGLDFSSQAMAA